MEGSPWASRTRSSPLSRSPAFTPRPSRFSKTAAAACSWSASRRRSATRMTELHHTAIHAVINNSSPQLSWNPFEDLATLFHFEFMVHAFQAGPTIAIVAGALGYFVVLRGSAFAAHALSHIGFAGATGPGASALGPIAGLLALTLRA